MWTDQLSAIGTFGAALLALAFGVASVIFAFHEYRVRKDEEADREEQTQETERQRIRSQAERIASWVEIDKSRYPSFEVVVENASDQPIWETSVHHAGLPGGMAFLTVVPATGQRRLPLQPVESFTEQAVDIQFRDNVGRNWSRPARVPGDLKLESETLFPGREAPPAPALYRFPRLKLWIENKWSMKVQKSPQVPIEQ